MPLLRQHEIEARKDTRPGERALPGLRGIDGEQAQRHGRREGMEQKDGRKEPAMKTSIFETITPELAEVYLSRNAEGQRKINPNRVADYAADMGKGLWVANGEAVIFDDAGRLIDGQHRLSAVIRAGVSVEMLVVRGVEGKSFQTIDQGFSRTLGTLAGCSSHDATIAKAICAYDHFGTVPKALKPGTSANRTNPLTKPMIAEWYADNVELVAETARITESLRRTFGKLSYVGAVVALRVLQLKSLDRDGTVAELCTAYTENATALANIVAKRMLAINELGSAPRSEATAKLIIWAAEQRRSGKQPTRDMSRYIDLAKYDLDLVDMAQ